MPAGGLIGEAGSMKSVEQKIAAAVSSEHAARAICAVSAGSKADDEDARQRIAEAGDGLAPILVIQIGAALYGRDFAAMRDEARTSSAVGDFVVKQL